MHPQVRASPLWLAVLLGGCVGADPDTSAHPTLPPYASLRTPVIAPVGEPVLLDAGASFDPEGEPLTYVFTISDAAPITSSEPALQHVFPAAGLYTVRVRVLDPHGERGGAQQDVSVQDSYPAVPDFCAATEDCVVGDECEGGVCYAVGGTVD